MSDWTTPDPRPAWSVVTRPSADAPVALTWIGRAADEGAAKLAALNAARIARRVACAIADGEASPADDVAISATDAGGTRSRISIGAGITQGTVIPERRALRRSNSLSRRALAAIEAAFLCGAARTAIPEGGDATVETLQVGDASFAYAVIVRTGFGNFEPDMGRPLEDALTAFAIAHWMAGGGNPEKTPLRHVEGRASATARAALRATLGAEAPQNAAIATGFLRRLGLEAEADAFAAEYGGAP